MTLGFVTGFYAGLLALAPAASFALWMHRRRVSRLERLLAHARELNELSLRSWRHQQETIEQLTHRVEQRL